MGTCSNSRKFLQQPFSKRFSSLHTLRLHSNMDIAGALEVAAEKGDRKSSTVLEELEEAEKLADNRRTLIDVREIMKIFESPYNDEGWTDLERFDSMDDFNECRGVKVEAGEIVELDLSGMLLTGET